METTDCIPVDIQQPAGWYAGPYLKEQQKGRAFDREGQYASIVDVEDAATAR